MTDTHQPPQPDAWRCCFAPCPLVGTEPCCDQAEPLYHTDPGDLASLLAVARAAVAWISATEPDDYDAEPQASAVMMMEAVHALTIGARELLEGGDHHA